MRSPMATVVSVAAGALAVWFSLAVSPARSVEKPRPDTPVVAKAVLGTGQTGESLLRPRAWAPFGKGFEYQVARFVCDNGDQAKAQRGVTQTVNLNQPRPEPIVAVCESKAEGVTGRADSDYSLYLDLIYTDNTPLWGQVAKFTPARTTGTAARCWSCPRSPSNS